jgi:MFS family permease
MSETALSSQQDSQPSMPAPGPVRPGLKSSLRALRHRNFQLFLSGQFISMIGTWMQSIAQDWLVYRLTGSSVLLGTVGFLGQIPVAILSPVAGIVADRFNRRIIVIITQSAMMILALILAALTLTKRVQVWEIMVLATLLGVASAFDIPTRQAFLMDMVGREDLLNGIALNSSVFHGARVFGPAIAGILIAWIGEGWCFFANGVSYIAVIAGLVAIRLVSKPRVRHEETPMQSLLQGLHLARKTAPIRALLLLLGLISLTSMSSTVLMPIFAGRILHGNSRALGLLMGATGFGAFFGAITLAIKHTVEGLERWVCFAAAGLGISLIAFSSSRHMWLSLLLIAPAGYCMIVTMGSTNTLLQVMVPDRFRGRVMGLFSMMFVGMAPVGALLAGLVAAKAGAPWTVALGGFASLTGAGIFAWHLPDMRESMRNLIREQGMAEIKQA